LDKVKKHAEEERLTEESKKEEKYKSQDAQINTPPESSNVTKTNIKSSF